jgi:hypothetical protein
MVCWGVLLLALFFMEVKHATFWFFVRPALAGYPAQRLWDFVGREW